jgi:hypothetical protein
MEFLGFPILRKSEAVARLLRFLLVIGILVKALRISSTT